MATAEEINSVIETLARNTNGIDRFAEEDFARMHRAWADVDPRVLSSAADRHINNSSFFPTLADMNRLIEEGRRERGTRLSIISSEDLRALEEEYARNLRTLEEESRLPQCEACAGSGYVVQIRVGELVTLAYWRALTGKTVPLGEPTEECGWQKCADCGAVGRRRPSGVEALNRAFT